MEENTQPVEEAQVEEVAVEATNTPGTGTVEVNAEPQTNATDNPQINNA